MTQAAAAKDIPGGSISGTETWTLADSPYLVLGDLTVEVAGKLTLEPGVEVLFPKTDVPGEGGDTRIELIVKGELEAEGTALLPITLRAQNEEFANSWHGVVIDTGAASASFKHVEILDANVGVSSAAPGKVLKLSDSVLRHNFTGVSLTDGTPAFDSVVFDENAVDGIYAEANAHSLSLSLTNCVFVLNGSHGVYLTATVGNDIDATIESSTFHGNVSAAIASRAFTADTMVTLSLRNSVLSRNGIFGVDTNSMDGAVTNVTATYTDFWVNGTDIRGGDTGVGCLFDDPKYLGAPDDLRLGASSTCVNAGSNIDAPTLDVLGRSRPQGASVDMGAYEYMLGDVAQTSLAGAGGAVDGGSGGAGPAGVGNGGAGAGAGGTKGGSDFAGESSSGETGAGVANAGGASAGEAADGGASAGGKAAAHASSGCGCRLVPVVPDQRELAFAGTLLLVAFFRARARRAAL
ncbi:MAG TPA: choice-of-anchor Q domain-containing protein [Polyangiaceae bacterium]|nr:choice-of-anchor Q domain-containing protein [Polyangiaceae bacterium]